MTNISLKLSHMMTGRRQRSGSILIKAERLKVLVDAGVKAMHTPYKEIENAETVSE